MASSSGSGKRARSSFGRGTVRPIDKTIWVLDIDTQAINPVARTLGPVINVPCTATGLRWSFNITSLDLVGTEPNTISWAIVLVREGGAVGNIAIAGSQSMYDPEQNVLAFGTSDISGLGTPGMGREHVEGTTKTMRKLRAGDNLHFTIRSDPLKPVKVFGSFQMFCRF